MELLYSGRFISAFQSRAVQARSLTGSQGILPGWTEILLDRVGTQGIYPQETKLGLLNFDFGDLTLHTSRPIFSQHTYSI